MTIRNVRFSAATVVILFLVVLFRESTAAEERNLLTKKHSPEVLKGMLLQQAQWHPFPRASERSMWQSLPQALREAYVKRGEQALQYDWPSLKVTAYLDYLRSGVRDRTEGTPNERRQKVLDLVLAECMEGKGRFVEHLVVGLWLICEETSWVIPAHIAEQRAGKGLPDKSEPIIDLVSGETGNLLAWAYYLLDNQLDAVSPLVRKRIKAEIDERILRPGLARDDFWWMWLSDKGRTSHHVNNWTPWICSNWLAAALILEDRKDERVGTVHKIMRCLDVFMNFYPDDGGCDEGPSYWGHAGGSLFECLELLETATQGQINIFDESLVKEIGRFIHRVHIADDYYVNFGDASPEVNIQSELVCRYGVRIGDTDLAGLGASVVNKQNILQKGIGGSLTRQLAFLFGLDQLKAVTPNQNLLRDVWLPQSEVMVARQEENTPKGFFLAAQGAHNEQSHNHNDVGSFVLYADGKPVIVDVGVEAYTAKTFSSERYDIWTMQSAYHNLPTINTYMQRSGKEYAARNVRYRLSDAAVDFSLDISRAYPKEAKIRVWDRAFRFDRQQRTVTLTDSYELDTDARDIAVSFMTPCQVETGRPGTLVLKPSSADAGNSSRSVFLRYNETLLTPVIEKIPLTDRRLKRAWGETIQRIILTARTKASKASWSVSFGLEPG